MSDYSLVIGREILGVQSWCSHRGTELPVVGAWLYVADDMPVERVEEGLYRRLFAMNALRRDAGVDKRGD